MPFTPFHFGPGLLAKSALPRHLSGTAFFAVNILIDVETLSNMMRGSYPLHTFLHTLPGAALAAAGTAFCLRAVRPPWLPERELPAYACWTGAFAGGLTHPLLDGLMHSDIRPFAPLTDANPLLGLLPVAWLHAACMGAALLAVAVFWLRSRG